MNIAVFSDIHGNHAALQACIDYCVAKGITTFILLGDYVTDCPYPEKTIEKINILRNYFKCYMVKGNREEYLINYRKNGCTGWKKGSASGALLYTYENLQNDDLELFDSLPIYELIDEKGMDKIEICHGSPANASEPLFPDKRNMKRTLVHLKADILLHGHSHIQGTYIYRGKKAINPGSVGLPWYHGGKTQFAILHSSASGWDEEMVQLDYDRQAILDDFESSGIMKSAPAWAAVTMHTIRTGVDLNQIVLLNAMRLCEVERGEVHWPDIPEKYWAISLRENNIDLYGNDITD
ncbi:MAG: metallophosphoesterase family protein [Butyrivibrio sp.]|nr:metallophosphoesterase family protein [Butyrivibrio sp.]